MRTFAAALLAILAAGGLSARAQEDSSGVKWEEWSDKIFERSQREHKLVILHLGAVWCHWCHVMEKMTYKDPEVVRLLQKHFIAVHVDQDARPDLSNRYEEYGWPATIMFDEKGKVVTSAYTEFEQFFPKPGWVEHDLEDIWDSTLNMVTTLWSLAKWVSSIT